MKTFFQNLRWSLRRARRKPGLTLIAVGSLAVGIGSSSAIFSLVHGIILKPLPYHEPERLFRLTSQFPKGALHTLRESSRTAQYTAATNGTGFNLVHGDRALRLSGSGVSADLFAVLGARPARGRTFQTGEDLPGNDRLMLISDSLWRREFGADTRLLGKLVRLDDVERQIIGIMPPDFAFPAAGTEVWVPLHMNPQAAGDFWGGSHLILLGRLKKDISTAAALAEFHALAPAIRDLFPWRMPDEWGKATQIVRLQESMVENVQLIMYLLLAAVSLVVVITCVNVANLLLTQVMSREREMAVRAALGAGRWRLLHQVLHESVLLSGAGGLLGVLFAWQGIELLKALLPADTPRITEVSLDPVVFSFAAALSVLTGILFGVVPALRASQTEMAGVFRSKGQERTAAGKRRHLPSILVAGEIALALVLVTATGLLTKSFWKTIQIDPGFRTDQLFTAKLTPDNSACNEQADCGTFYGTVLEELERRPAVVAVAAVDRLPLTASLGGFAAAFEDHPLEPGAPAPMLWGHVTTPGYFKVMGIPLLEGRALVSSDRRGSPLVVVVSRGLANEFWPGESALGKKIKPVWQQQWRTVVGVVGDVRRYRLERDPSGWLAGEVYVPYAQGVLDQPPLDMFIVAKTTGDPLLLAADLRGIVALTGLSVPLSEVRSMDEVLADSLAAPRSTLVIFLCFAAVALFLGGLGIYGVMAAMVRRQLPELGVRIALGARRVDITRMVLSRGLTLVTTGILAGLLGCLLVSRALERLLIGVSSQDTAVFSAAAVILAAVALLAGYLPARRASRLDPLRVLRDQQE